MKFFKNKNTVVLAVSALLIVIAIIVAIAASAGGNADKKKETTTKPTESVNLDLGAIANKNNQSDKKDNTSANVKNEPGKYKIATKDDPLGLRIKPGTDADRLLYIDKGETVEVLAVWEDWGYVVYGTTGGWLSMNYLERVAD